MHPADQGKDTATLRYDRFLSSDGTQCEVREAYTGPQALIAHRVRPGGRVLAAVRLCRWVPCRVAGMRRALSRR